MWHEGANGSAGAASVWRECASAGGAGAVSLGSSRTLTCSVAAAFVPLSASGTSPA
eukprot:CAMPEP_0195136644 /NCGR_PEP_ID=MMETSP0448-20130528/154588_1 /TAXON_ID=66468 /ORGANISM="Heterocapsa triquestra, Strain CCMP 448" /LENGTH=55 /DNA_ID=CAMNT_0040174839 /DNA_START=96 /DNA_END=259 /DNA_ORIENTATION=+